MSFDETESTEWLERELRQVPLPRGLLVRLREVAAHGADDELDAELRHVAFPEGLLTRLCEAPIEVELDERLAAVDVPGGFGDRLLDVVAEAAFDDQMAEIPLPAGFTERLLQVVADEALDEQLRTIPMPAALDKRVRRAVSSRRRTIRRFALAASLMLACGLTLLNENARRWMVGWFDGSLFASRELADPSPVESIDDLASLPDFDPVGSDLIVAGEAAPDTIVGNAAPNNAQEWAKVDDNEPRDLLPSHEIDAAFGAPGKRSNDPLASTWSALTGVLGADGPMLPVPELDATAPLRIAGMAAPLDRGYDRVSLAVNGVHPFVRLNGDRPLTTSFVPLSLRTTSFDDLYDRLSRRAPVGDTRVRVEDFLAAMNYGYRSAEPGRLGLRTAAGPAPFAAENVKLLQVGVQAGSLPFAGRAPVHLTIAVDASAAMQWHGRLTQIRRALAELPRHLRPLDRLTLISFNHRVDVLLADAGPDDTAVWQRAVDWLAPQGSANLEQGIAAAASAAAEASAEAGVVRQVIVITEAQPSATEVQLRRLASLLKAAKQQDLRWSLIEMRAAEGHDTRLARLATLADTRLIVADGAHDVSRHLGATLEGRPRMVAARTALTLKFNPAAVAEYRLVGHDPIAGGRSTDDLRGELAANESATGLYEVVLRPNNVNDVAVAELTWNDPATGREVRLSQRISRLQFAPSFAASPMSLQAAALAAETAEVLRASVYTPRGAHNLARVAAQAQQAHSELRGQPEFERLVRLIELARQAGMDRR